MVSMTTRMGAFSVDRIRGGVLTFLDQLTKSRTTNISTTTCLPWLSFQYIKKRATNPNETWTCKSRDHGSLHEPRSQRSLSSHKKAKGARTSEHLEQF